jgi:uncharacterized protein YaiI (UPF0178 family)
MRVLIDADACPVKAEAIAEARKRGLSVLLVSNTGHSMDRYTSRAGVEAIQVGTGRDSADFAIVERLEAGDVVVTQDIGLAAMVLGRGARAISPRGRVYDPIAIDAQLAVRHAEQQHRRSGGRTKGPSAFEEDDRERFTAALSRLLGEATR